MIKSIEEADILSGTKVFLRADWNVPIVNGEVADTSRIEASKQTIDFLISKKAKIILASHLSNEKESLELVFEKAKEFFDCKIVFIKDPFSNEGKNILNELQEGEIVVLENLRFWKGEETNDTEFSKKLASLASIYVNEAFSVSHREHSSVVGVPKFLPHFAGFWFLNEYQKLSEALNPEHPFLFILGGAKFETKLPLVEKFLNIADNIFIGGANAYEASLLNYIVSNPKVSLPIGDVRALDANTETLSMLEHKIKTAKFILWNGPLGKYEEGFTAGTVALARLLAESGAKVITGGGDTENLIDELDIKDKFYFISLSGGAMLDFLAKGTLVGIEALN